MLNNHKTSYHSINTLKSKKQKQKKKTKKKQFILFWFEHEDKDYIKKFIYLKYGTMLITIIHKCNNSMAKCK